MNPSIAGVKQPGVSFGSGTNLLGAPASSVLGMPGIQQQSPSSAGYTPGIMPPNQQYEHAPAHSPQQLIQSGISTGGLPPLGFPNGQPVPPQAPQMPPMTAPQPPQGVVGMPPSNPEAMMIIKTLASRINHINKGEQMQRGEV